MARPFTPLSDRFWTKVRKGPKCWIWTASKNYGYGQIGAGGKKGRPLRAHRVAYELLVGPIPEGMTLDHLCRNPACVRPEHLEPVSDSENLRRGLGPASLNRRKVRCLRGHSLADPANLYLAKGRYGPKRFCRECQRFRDRRRYRRHGKRV